MLAQERLLRITELLIDRETRMVSVSELSDLLGVSTMTVRRDLDRLEEMSILRRVRGGAVAYQERRWDDPFVEREGRFSREKQAVGWAAAQIVEDGDRLLLDGGTTTSHVARNLAYKNDVVVITHSLPAASELARLPRITTMLLGGTLHHKERYAYGPESLRRLGQITADKFFLSAAGYSIEAGINDPYPHDVTLKRAMMEAASQVILVADSSKWGKNTGAQIAPFSDIHRFVTDDSIAPEAIEAIEAEGVEVITPNRVSTRTVFREVLAGA
jgi:DeoR/GlpR family transcriptional regulator of sugar metabolism